MGTKASENRVLGLVPVLIISPACRFLCGGNYNVNVTRAFVLCFVDTRGEEERQGKREKIDACMGTLCER